MRRRRGGQDDLLARAELDDLIERSNREWDALIDEIRGRLAMRSMPPARSADSGAEPEEEE